MAPAACVGAAEVEGVVVALALAVPLSRPPHAVGELMPLRVAAQISTDAEGLGLWLPVVAVDTHTVYVDEGVALALEELRAVALWQPVAQPLEEGHTDGVELPEADTDTEPLTEGLAERETHVADVEGVEVPDADRDAVEDTEAVEVPDAVIDAVEVTERVRCADFEVEEVPVPDEVPDEERDTVEVEDAVDVPDEERDTVEVEDAEDVAVQLAVSVACKRRARAKEEPTKGKRDGAKTGTTRDHHTEARRANRMLPFPGCPTSVGNLKVEDQVGIAAHLGPVPGSARATAAARLGLHDGAGGPGSRRRTRRGSRVYSGYYIGYSA